MCFKELYRYHLIRFLSYLCQGRAEISMFLGVKWMPLRFFPYLVFHPRGHEEEIKNSSTNQHEGWEAGSFHLLHTRLLYNPFWTLLLLSGCICYWFGSEQCGFLGTAVFIASEHECEQLSKVHVSDPSRWYDRPSVSPWGPRQAKAWPNYLDQPPLFVKPLSFLSQHTELVYFIAGLILSTTRCMLRSRILLTLSLVFKSTCHTVGTQ